MTLANVLLGMAIGFPMMIAVGPISVLLLDQGLERGVRAAAPAVVGVAAADLSLSSAAAVTGATVAAALAPVTGWLTLVAVGVLVWLAIDLARSALGGLRPAPSPAAPPGVSPAGAGSPVRDPAVLSTAVLPAAVPHDDQSMVGVGSGVSVAHRSATSAGDGFVAGTGVGDGVSTGAGADEVDARGSSFGHLAGARLAMAFYGITMVNPLTLVLFASVVVAGGAGIGTAGWALGMALASLLAHGSFVVLGGALRTTLSPVASARLRLGAAVFMAGLAVHFVVGL